MATPSANPPGRLISHFADKDRAKQNDAWSELWDTDQSGLWDRGFPSPALIDFIESRSDVLPQPTGERRLRALVPGCGKGYDPVMLALHGFDAYGLEVSKLAVRTASAYAAAELANPSTYNFVDQQSQSEPPGLVRIIQGDFFERDWEAACAAEDGTKAFDLIYDYTFLCALLPEMRRDWAKRMRELLAPHGVLVCLEFPLFKDLGVTGPPWPLQGAYWNLLGEGGDGIVDDPAEDGPGNGPFTRMLRFKPPRSYKSGQGADMMSVWKLKQ